ncbi:MAG TPA: UDP-N-acetylmuramoyl-L-alanyl-D-glutamate--2,6-diaminopimelate ligase [Chitinophagales bacterium]|nr:UDP-N-acetylmuramoyl-L-alanyl-D-glutamate--2,6-diaminopimelate ligase [Chitinophagales bacterium]
MKKLKDILYKVSLLEVAGSTDISISELTFDSRNAVKGSLFIAARGTQADGHRYISQAVDKGAAAVVCEELPDTLSKGVTYVKVKDSSIALGIIAHNFFDEPSAKMKVVAVTGTNGKTTTVTLLYRMMRQLGYKAGLLSTVQNQINDTVVPSTHTTPDAIQLNSLLARMVSEGCGYCFMEASSHAIVQHRIAGLHFAGAVFTNITHDHLDYHKTFKDYIEAKKKLFDELTSASFALINLDDRNAKVIVQNTKAKVYTYSLKKASDFRLKILESGFNGLLVSIDNQEVYTRLIGEFNAYNILAVYATAMLLGIEKVQALKAISSLSAAEGRFDYFISPKKKIIVIVDYAHTPDALRNVLASINAIRTGNEQVITVVGCGGNRDKEKRPVMARIACEMSTRIVLTSDNPRNENPEEILHQMQEGVTAQYKRKALSIVDRKEAIKTACALAQPGDIILLAGKGHEKYQEIAGKKYPFDDKEILKETLKELDE